MTLIAALLTDADHRHALGTALRDHALVWADSWKALDALVRARPALAAVAAPDAEPRKDGALRVLHFVERYPATPLIAWGVHDVTLLFRLGKAGAREVVPASHAGNAEVVREIVARALGPDLAALLIDRLRGRASAEALRLVRAAAAPSPEGMLHVARLAERRGVSVSTLERRCERWGAPPPGRLLLWVRVLRGLMWLREPGRSVESVAGQLDYSSGAAFGRAVEATLGERPARLRSDGDFEAALERFAAEFAPATVGAG